MLQYINFWAVAPLQGGAGGFADVLKSTSNGNNDIPYMVDSNPKMFK